MRGPLVLPLTAVLALAACGTDTAATTEDPATSDLLYAEALVIESGDDGAQLCVGGVGQSLPPTCGGPELVGWDWDQAERSRTMGDTTWGGRYVVIGTYDQEADRFTMSEPPVLKSKYDGWRPDRPEQADDLATPCEEPEGGWRAVDESMTSMATLNQATSLAHKLPDFADVWWDEPIDPDVEGPRDPSLNDPHNLVLNVAVTDDPASAEESVREVWGGPLCVTRTERTSYELGEIQTEVFDVDGALYAGTGRDHVELGVVHDDGSLQQRFDEEYGEGVVVVYSALQPYEG